MRRAVVIVGKTPVPGLAKTRLVPPLSNVAAAELYRAFLLDTLLVARRLEWERVALIHPRGHGPALRTLSDGVALVEQPAEGLADALSFAFAHHFRLGYEHVVLIGSDNPTLTVEPILAAERADDVGIGPTRDGGYYLIGMRQPHLELFADIEWSTPRVFAQTLERARELGLEVDVVQEWYDVDEPADLEVLETELARLPLEVAPNTREVLRGWYQDGWRGATAHGIGISHTPGNPSGVPAPRQDHN